MIATTTVPEARAAFAIGGYGGCGLLMALPFNTPCEIGAVGFGLGVGVGGGGSGSVSLMTGAGPVFTPTPVPGPGGPMGPAGPLTSVLA